MFTIEANRVVVCTTPDFLALAGTVSVPDDVRGLTWDGIKEMAYETDQT